MSGALFSKTRFHDFLLWLYRGARCSWHVAGLAANHGFGV